MALKFYNAYLKSLAKTPVEDWREITQQMIYDVWEDTSTVTTIQGQTSLGSLTFGPESIQLNSVINPKTGKDFGDDFRKIIYKTLFDNELPPSIIPSSKFLVQSVGGVELYRFQTIDGEDFLVRSSNRWLGKYYQFNGFTWLTTNTNTEIGSSASAILTRCNNWLKWLDADGKLHQWECVFQRNLTSTNFDMGSEGVAEVQADTLIKVQRNDETSQIPFNQRFLFDGHAFKVKQINNHISETYMELYMFETQIQSNDDLVNNIAGGGGEITPTTNEIKFLPEITKILQGETQNFTIYNYINGIPNSDTFDITTSGPLIESNYILNVLDGNNFSIKNVSQSNIPLEIVGVDNSTGKSITLTLMLGGQW